MMSSNKASNWLLFLEDPGALNFFLPLVQNLLREKKPFQIYASGHAYNQLKINGFFPKHCTSKADIPPLLEFSLVVVGTSENPESVAFDIVSNSKANCVPCVAIVDSGINASFRFKGRTNDPLFYAPNYLIVPDSWAMQKYLSLGFEVDKVFKVGYPTLEKLVPTQGRSILRRKILPHDALNRKIIVFISEISTGLNPTQYLKSDSYTLCGRGNAEARTEIVVEELLDAVKRLQEASVAEPYLILRRHPKESDDHLRRYASEFDFISRQESPIELVGCADLVIGMTSMLLTEAAIIGQNVISIVPRKSEADWIPAIARNKIKICHEREQLFSSIKAKLELEEKKLNESSCELVINENDFVKNTMTALVSIEHNN